MEKQPRLHVHVFLPLSLSLSPLLLSPSPSFSLPLPLSPLALPLSSFALPLLLPPSPPLPSCFPPLPSCSLPLPLSLSLLLCVQRALVYTVCVVQIPQFILEDAVDRDCGAQCQIICTQPRRISAISGDVHIYTCTCTCLKF